MSEVNASKPSCSACGSPDVVSYWNKCDSNDEIAVPFRRMYPDARRCVDCGFVDSDPERNARLAGFRTRLRFARKDETS